MIEVIVHSADEKERNNLLSYFAHYKIREVLEKRVDCYLKHNFTIVAKHEERIVGVLQWYVKENPTVGVAEFEEVHVLEDYRGMGVGSRLVQKGIEAVKDYFSKMGIKPRRTYLFVGKENKGARRLYENHGFKLTCEAGDLFADNELELLYTLNLQGTSK